MSLIKITLFLVLFAFLPSVLTAQVKIGDNPDLINSNSILELESNNKALVITRLSQIEMNALVPLNGALVYNIDAQCVFVFDGLVWKNLCDEPNISISSSSPTNNSIGDFWFNDTNNQVSVWDGSQWLSINVNPRRGSGAPNTSTINGLAGDIYVDTNTGDIFTFNGISWIPVNQAANVSNGISMVVNEIQLGGALIAPTIITTNAINTLAIQGLQDTPFDDTLNSIVVVDNNSGELRKSTISNIIMQEQIVIIANDGQSQFTAPLLITDIDKLDVYRNGARIEFTIVNNTTIEVEAEAICFDGDEIRIVQLK